MFIKEKKGFSSPALFPTFWRNFLFFYHPLDKRKVATISSMKKHQPKASFVP
jgi:hypothetical protein